VRVAQALDIPVPDIGHTSSVAVRGAAQELRRFTEHQGPKAAELHEQPDSHDARAHGESERTHRRIAEDGAGNASRPVHLLPEHLAAQVGLRRPEVVGDEHPERLQLREHRTLLGRIGAIAPRQRVCFEPYDVHVFFSLL